MDDIMKSGEELAGRIRWEPTEPGSDDNFGYVGALDPAVFTIWAPRRDDEAWEVTSALPQLPGERHVGADREETMAEAERWLAEFVSSLGAAFPEDEISDEFDAEAFLAQFAPGRRVRFEHPDAGWPGEGAEAREILVFGAEYRIAWSDIGQSKTTLALEGIEGAFNSVLFEPVDDPEAAVTAAGGTEQS